VDVGRKRRRCEEAICGGRGIVNRKLCTWNRAGQGQGCAPELVVKDDSKQLRSNGHRDGDSTRQHREGAVVVSMTPWGDKVDELELGQVEAQAQLVRTGER
jgi:hypothetical protein